MARTTASKKAKGKRLEKQTAKRIEDVLGGYGVNATPTPMSGAIDRFKSDIFTNLPVSIECKNQERWAPLKWWKQCISDAKGKIPILVMSKNNMKNPKVMIEFEDLLFFLELSLQSGWSSNTRRTKRR